jgi:hypothetical protein
MSYSVEPYKAGIKGVQEIVGVVQSLAGTVQSTIRDIKERNVLDRTHIESIRIKANAAITISREQAIGDVLRARFDEVIKTMEFMKECQDKISSSEGSVLDNRLKAAILACLDSLEENLDNICNDFSEGLR